MLVYEAGEASRFDIEAIKFGVRGILRVMKSLGMIRYGVEAPLTPPRVSSGSSWVRAKRTGFCEMIVRLGAEVSEGDSVAVVFDALGRSRSLVKARTSGILVGHVTSPIVHRGDAIAHIAELSAERDHS